MHDLAHFNTLNVHDINGLLFERAAEGLLVVDDKGTICMVNPQIEQLFGYSKTELLGKSVDLLVPKKTRKLHQRLRAGYNAKPRRRSMAEQTDLVGLRKDGSVIPVEISLNHFEVDGQFLVMALITDVSEKRKMLAALQHTAATLKRLNAELENRVAQRTKALHESQQIYKLIARNFPNGIINVIDRKYNYVFAEGSELHENGISGPDLIGTSFLDGIKPKLQKEVKDKLAPAFRDMPVNFEFDTGDSIYRINAVGLKKENEAIGQVLIVSQNITDQKTTEIRVQEALNQEKRLNELKSRFIAMASHEFRTPLTTVMNASALLTKYLGRTDSLDKQRNHLERINASIRQLNNILNDFLSLDRLEDGKVDFQDNEFAIPELVNNAVRDVKTHIKTGQEIIINHKGKEKVCAPEHVVVNILNNLLSNALKYSPEDSTVLLDSSVYDNCLYIRITDEGMGIPRDEQSQVFERFFRAKNVINIPGTGLGLNIVKKYLDALGGSIAFESEMEKGSIFSIAMPVRTRSQNTRES